jgi:hypothetical protein
MKKLRQPTESGDSIVGNQRRPAPSMRATACRSRVRKEMLKRLVAMQSRNRVRDHRS